MDKIQIGLNAGAIWNTMDANHDKHVWDVEELQQARHGGTGSGVLSLIPTRRA